MHRRLKTYSALMDGTIGYQTDTEPCNPHSDHHSARVDRTFPIRFREAGNVS
jgi:hypothetical protein